MANLTPYSVPSRPLRNRSPFQIVRHPLRFLWQSLTEKIESKLDQDHPQWRSVAATWTLAIVDDLKASKIKEKEENALKVLRKELKPLGVELRQNSDFECVDWLPIINDQMKFDAIRDVNVLPHSSLWYDLGQFEPDLMIHKRRQLTAANVPQTRAGSSGGSNLDFYGSADAADAALAHLDTVAQNEYVPPLQVMMTSSHMTDAGVYIQGGEAAEYYGSEPRISHLKMADPEAKAAFHKARMVAFENEHPRYREAEHLLCAYESETPPRLDNLVKLLECLKHLMEPFANAFLMYLYSLPQFRDHVKGASTSRTVCDLQRKLWEGMERGSIDQHLGPFLKQYPLGKRLKQWSKTSAIFESQNAAKAFHNEAESSLNLFLTYDEDVPMEIKHLVRARDEARGRGAARSPSPGHFSQEKMIHIQEFSERLARDSQHLSEIDEAVDKVLKEAAILWVKHQTTVPPEKMNDIAEFGNWCRLYARILGRIKKDEIACDRIIHPRART